MDSFNTKLTKYSSCCTVALLIALPGITLTPQAAADSATLLSHTLPVGLQGLSSIYDGTHIYVFGGDEDINQNQLSDRIYQYNPSTGSVSTLAAKLPTPRTRTAAVWDGSTHAYIFGGTLTSGIRTDEILRFTPSTGTLITLTTKLPEMRESMSAVWYSGSVYILGGYTFSSSTDDIIRFTPSTSTITKLTNKLPYSISSHSTAQIGANVYLVGGFKTSPVVEHTKDIVRYNIATNTDTVVGGKLPHHRTSASAATDGTDVFIFSGGAWRGDILRYDVSADSVSWMADPMPSGRTDSTAHWIGNAAYILGGLGTTGPSFEIYDQIIKYTLEPYAPTSLTASTSSTPGQIDLSWTAPQANSYVGSLTGYKVYRSLSSGGPYSLIATTGSASYSDTGLPSSATRYYQVVAYNGDGDSPASNTAQGFTAGKPSAPQNLDLTPGPGIQQIRLEWDPPASTGGVSLTSYSIYRNTGSGWNWHASVGPSTTTYTDTGLALLGQYSYQVTASNVIGESPESNTECARPFPTGTVVDLLLTC